MPWWEIPRGKTVPWREIPRGKTVPWREIPGGNMMPWRGNLRGENLSGKMFAGKRCLSGRVLKLLYPSLFSPLFAYQNKREASGCKAKTQKSKNADTVSGINKSISIET